MKIEAENSVIPFNIPWITEQEKEMLLESLSGDLSSDGDFNRGCIDRIRDILNVPYAFLTTSCTHSIELALMVMGLEPDQEVLLPSFTFVSVANAVLMMGGRPVFVDIEESTLNIDPIDLKRKIGPSTAGIIPVHYAGVACDMEAISTIAEAAGLWVVEDAAQAFGSRYKGKPLGTLGQFGCFSFHSTKNIVCGEGGALVTRSKELFTKAEISREKGTNRSALMRKEVDKYTWLDKGSSYVLAEPLAAILLAQLMRFDEIQKERERVYMRYKEALTPLVHKGYIRFQKVPEYCEPNWHIFCFCVADEKEQTRLLSHLRDHGIKATFHYVPLHTSPYAQYNLGTKEGDLPITEKVAQTLIRLPLFPSMNNQQVEQVVTAVNKFFC